MPELPTNSDSPQTGDSCPPTCSTIFLSDWKPDHSIQFRSHQNTEIGRLTWNDGVLRFTGNADESAKLFIQTMAAQLGMPFDLANAKGEAQPPATWAGGNITGEDHRN